MQRPFNVSKKLATATNTAAGSRSINAYLVRESVELTPPVKFLNNNNDNNNNNNNITQETFQYHGV